MTSINTISRPLAGEFIGTAMLLAAVVGSGIMAERLSSGNTAVALLSNTIAIGAALFTLILMFAPVSGAHFNPVVSIVAARDREIAWHVAGLYTVVQVLGAGAGVAIANLMFELPAYFPSTKIRTGFGIWLGEFVATFGLVGVVVAVSRHRKPTAVAAAVAAYITAASWFTSSTSFANPAVTIARSLTDTFTGIRPADAPAFIAAQLLAGMVSSIFFDWLIPKKT